MKRLQVDINTRDAEKYAQDLERKQQLGKEALEYCSGFITVDLSTFNRDMTQSFETSFNEQYKDAFNKAIIQDKRYELVNFNKSILTEIQKRYDAIQIPLDAGFNALTKPDFGVYLTTKDEIEKYKAKQRLLDAIAEYEKETNLEIKPALFQRAAIGQFSYDYSTSSLTPNY